jgi:hypothetical protein
LVSFCDAIKQRLSGLLQQGLQPRQLAMALALGATIGLLPTVWGTSLLCLLAARLPRLNQLAVQLANYLVYPLQPLLFLPYLTLGELLFSDTRLRASPEDGFAALPASPWAGLERCWQNNLHAVCAWLLTSPLLLTCSFLLCRFLLKRLAGAPVPTRKKSRGCAVALNKERRAHHGLTNR